MINFLLKINLTLLLFLSATNFFAQTEITSQKQEKTVVIEMKSGDEYEGIITDENDENIVLKTVNGEINLIAKQVEKIKEPTKRRKNTLPNHHSTRYFFSPSAIPLKKKKGYYRNSMLTLNGVNYGVTNNISIGAGFEFISAIIGEPMWYITPKVGFKVSKNVHIGGGVTLAGIVNNTKIATIGYAVGTYGNSESNISLGIGYGFSSNILSDYPSIMIGGTRRINKSLAFLSENYFFPSTDLTDYVGIQGIRIISNNSAFDIGGMTVLRIAGIIPALPCAGYTRKF